MSLLLGKITLRVIKERYDLEPVEAQDENDAGYLWAKREDVTVFDLNPEHQRIWITPDDVSNTGRSPDET